MRRIAVLDAPSNLGLRPPTATSVPGCAKAPGALRDHGLLTKLAARDAGCLTPPRYDPGDWRPGDGVAHAAQIAAYSRRLADRIGSILDAGEFPVILGGDCSILLGSGLAMHRLGEAVGGRIGLVFVDGHSDFRHPGNASYVGAAAGEDLALVTGRGQADLASIEGRRPYFRDIDVVVLGLRAQDEYRLDLQAAGIVTRPVPALRVEGAARSAQWARDQLVDCAGYWLHVDVDVLDPAVMPAVDAPTPGGIAFPELEILLAGLVESPHCLGVEITVFDPDYDPDGEYAAEIASTVAAGLAAARTVALRPDLIAARADLAKPAFTLRSEPQPESQPSAPEAESQPVPAPEAAPQPEPEPAAAPEAESQPAPDPEAPAAPTAESQPDPAEEADPDADYASDAANVASPAHKADEAAAGLASLFRPSGDADDAFRTSLRRPSASADAAERAWLRPPGDAAAAVRASLSRRAGLNPARKTSLLRRPADDDADAGDAVPSLGPAPDADDAVAAHVPEDAARVTIVDKPEISDLSGGAVDQAGAEPEVADPFIARPLGQAPLLDSKPLPATRPGMLRPRLAEDLPVDDHPAEDLPVVEGFSLPVQRPAFDLGSGSPADIA